jgi:hypothetical protein
MYKGSIDSSKCFNIKQKTKDIIDSILGREKKIVVWLSVISR